MKQNPYNKYLFFLKKYYRNTTSLHHERHKRDKQQEAPFSDWESMPNAFPEDETIISSYEYLYE